MSSTLSSVLEVCLGFFSRQDCCFCDFFKSVVFHSVYVFIPVFSSLSYPPSYVLYLALLSKIFASDSVMKSLTLLENPTALP